MRIWIYGSSPEEVREMIEKTSGSGDTVSGTSLLAEADSSFPQSGLLPAISAAIRREFDLLLIPTFELLGNRTKETIELFQSYGISVRSLSSRGIKSS